MTLEVDYGEDLHIYAFDCEAIVQLDEIQSTVQARLSHQRFEVLVWAPQDGLRDRRACIGVSKASSRHARRLVREVADALALAHQTRFAKLAGRALEVGFAPVLLCRNGQTMRCLEKAAQPQESAASNAARYIWKRRAAKHVAESQPEVTLLSRCMPGEKRTRRRDWSSLSNLLVDFVSDAKRRDVVRGYQSLCDFLWKTWQLRVIETPMPEHGRLGTRLASFAESAYVYIAINSRLQLYERMLALLHELGHLALHIEELVRAGSTYQSICMRPSIEHSIGNFVEGRDGQRLRLLRELEADVFVTYWLAPRYLDTRSAERQRERRFSGLDPVTEKYILLRDAFADLDYRTIPRQALSAQARIARAEVDATRLREYDASDSLWQRLSWALFRRGTLGGDFAHERTRLMQKYYDLFPDPAKVLYGVAQRPERASKANSSTWLRRASAEGLEDQLARPNWEPLLILSDETSAPYYIPISPIPSDIATDSAVPWRHMMKPLHSPANDLRWWVSIARSERAGLLLFPRNPAERIMETHL